MSHVVKIESKRERKIREKDATAHKGRDLPVASRVILEQNRWKEMKCSILYICLAIYYFFSSN